MMQAIRAIKEVDKDGVVHVQLPPSFGRRVELIILPLSDEESQNAPAWELMKLQETSGFARDVLGNPAEDVWNEL